MNSKGILLTAAGCLGAIVVLGQAPAPQTGPGVQAPQDAKYPDFIAKNCKVPPGRGGGAGRGSGSAAARGGGGAGRGNPAELGPPVDYTITEISGVIAAGQKWKTVWTGTGNNADGIIATKDGGILAAQNTNSTVMKIDKDGKASVVYMNTNTGGAVSMNKKGVLFVVERGLGQAIEELSPNRHIFANKINSEPFECTGGLINDLTAASNGGIYFTMGNLFYVNPQGVVTKQGTVAGTNGIVLSADEKTLYVTGRIGEAAAAGGRGGPGGGGGSMIAYDVQPDGTLAHERQFAMAGGDGSTIDAAGRIYTTGGPAITVLGSDGKVLGTIPTPRNVITVAFSGKDKKTLYAVFNNQRQDEIYTIQMIAQGYKGRMK